ncbi:MAG TPA: branched-chain amino acid ABC transporter permease [Xanthobacteraceae bacterium]|nr:branched-chain amino acid ABC transporter permease [Xanthobacteraceae bacterium]
MLSFTATLLLDGISYGMILFIISVGLTITMGLMRVVNLAHGSFAMIGGYVAGYCTQRGMNFYAALAFAAIIPGILGGLAEVTLYRPLYRKGELSQVLLTIGIVFVTTAAVSEIFGAFPYPVQFPDYLVRPVDIGFRTYPAYRLFLIGVGAAIALVLWLVIENSVYGAKLRAAVDNPHMARAVGMNVNLLFTGTFVVGCALAGLGGAVGAGIMSLEPSYALKYVVLFLVVVIVGGEGSFKGSFVAAMALGIIDTLGKYFFTQAAPYLLYAAVFVLLLWRPQGLLPPKSAT